MSNSIVALGLFLIYLYMGFLIIYLHGKLLMEEIEMLKDLILNGYGKEQKYNCAEKILCGANEAYNLGLDKEALKLAAGFGGGMGIESVCGALTASIMVLSKLFVENIAHESKIKEITSEFLNRYENEMKSIGCAQLKGMYRDELKGCEDIIIKAAEVLDYIVTRELQSQQRSNEKRRCKWVTDDPLYIEYHDKEWGVPVHDDRKLFELLILEGAQAGLSWITILKKRENYRKAFDNFNPEKIAKYDDAKIQQLLLNKGIIRNRRKIESTISNAKAFLDIKREFGSFDKYIWQFVGGDQIRNSWMIVEEVPANTKESDAMSKDLKKRGFKFVGSTICYSFMQAIGMVNDHTIDCYRYDEV